MKSVIAKLKAGMPGDFNPALKVAVLDADYLIQDISHPDSAFSLKQCAQSVQAFFGDDWREGDAVILNDPNQGATHVSQLTAVAPRFSSGVITGWTVVRANIPDQGGWSIGGYSPEAVDRWAEAARFVPAKILLAGRQRREVLDLLSLNSRTPNTTRGLALAIAQASLSVQPDEDSDRYLALYTQEAERLLERIEPLTDKQAEGVAHIKAPADWASPGSIKAAVRFANRRIQATLSAPTRSTHPINLAESTTKDIVAFAMAAALGCDADQTDALASLLDIRIDGELLAAPMEACVGIGRETSGSALLHAVFDAIGKLAATAHQPDEAMRTWLDREALAALDWNTGALTADTLNRFLFIESEIAR